MKKKKNQSFYLNIFQFLEVKFSIYLNRRVFVMHYSELAKLFGTSQLVVYFAVIARADNNRRMKNSLVWYFKEG